MIKLKVEGKPNLVRDSASKAIINTDQAGLNTYLEKRKLFEMVIKQQQRIELLENEINKINALLINNNIQ